MDWILGFITFGIPGTMVLGLLHDFITVKLQKKHLGRKCLDCRHRLEDSGKNPAYMKCNKTFKDKTTYDASTGQDVRKIDFAYCSHSRGSGAWSSILTGLAMYKRPFCSKTGWFWEKDDHIQKQ